MIIHATLVRAGLEAAVAHCQHSARTAPPSPTSCTPTPASTTRRGQLQPDGAPPARHRRRRRAHRAVDRRPREPRDRRPRCASTWAPMPGVDGEYRTRLFHAIRDLTADTYGGWKAVTNIQAGGGLYAQRIVTRKHYDLDGAKHRALARRRPGSTTDTPSRGAGRRDRPEPRQIALAALLLAGAGRVVEAAGRLGRRLDRPGARRGAVAGDPRAVPGGARRHRCVDDAGVGVGGHLQRGLLGRGAPGPTPGPGRPGARCAGGSPGTSAPAPSAWPGSGWR